MEYESKLGTDKGAQDGKRLGRLSIQVTEDIINTALPANSGHCMASDAVKLAAESRGWKIGKVLTDLQTIRFTDLKKKIRYICFTPRTVQVALLAFDQGQKPEPFSFRLQPVQILQSRKSGGGHPKARIAIKKVSGKPAGRPIKHGGPPLPTTIGLRREFGIRQMGVYKAPSETETALSN